MFWSLLFLALASSTLAGIKTDSESVFILKSGKIRTGHLHKVTEGNLYIEAKDVRGLSQKMVVPAHNFERVVLPDGNELDLELKEVAPEELMAYHETYEYQSNLDRADSVVIIESSRKSLEESLKEIREFLAIDIPSSVGKPSLAVIPLKVTQPKHIRLSALISEYILSDFKKSDQFDIKSAAQYRTVLSNHNLNVEQGLDDDKLLEAGEKLSANYILTGLLQEGENQKMILSFRLISVAKGRVMTSVKTDISQGEIADLSSRLKNESEGAWSAMGRSLIWPGWGQFHHNHALRGTFWTSTTLIAAGWLGLEASRDPQNIEYPLATLAGIWVLNLIDAGLVGSSHAKQNSTLYFTLGTDANRGPYQASVLFRF
jgi:TolB-like protein